MKQLNPVFNKILQDFKTKKGNKRSKFQVGDIVGTNIEYMQGFNDDVIAPPGLTRLQNLKVIKVIPLEAGSCDSEFTEPYIYVCKSKTRTYEFNQCFLKLNGV